MLNTETVYFACSATVDEESERFILDKCGFHPEGNNPGDLEIIRTSFDRPDISLCIYPIPVRRQLDVSGEPTPLRIPKAVSFIDGLTKVKRVAGALQAVLPSTRIKSTTNSRNRTRIFGYVLPRRRWVRESISLISRRSSNGIYRCPPIWQRIGRAVRKHGLWGIAVLFISYWMFDRLGYGGPPASNDAPNRLTVRTKRRRHQLKRDRAPSGLVWCIHRIQLARKLTMVNRRTAQLRQKLISPPPSSSRSTPGKAKKKKWSKEELKKRRELSSKWARVINAPCHRSVILDMLQEARYDLGTRDDMAPSESPYRQFRPKADTAAGIALHLLEDRLSERATAMVPEENRWMRWLADVLLDSEYQWAVVKSIWRTFFPLDEWMYKAEYADPLVQFLRINCDTIVAKARESKRGRDPPTPKSIRRQWAQSKVILRLARRHETMVSHISLQSNGQSLHRKASAAAISRHTALAEIQEPYGTAFAPEVISETEDICNGRLVAVFGELLQSGS
ncbi:hypothetical protein V8E54_012013 [Elaphomyces granulatus]